MRALGERISIHTGRRDKTSLEVSRLRGHIVLWKAGVHDCEVPPAISGEFRQRMVGLVCATSSGRLLSNAVRSTSGPAGASLKGVLGVDWGIE